jgi:hypothetical protein
MFGQAACEVASPHCGGLSHCNPRSRVVGRPSHFSPRWRRGFRCGCDKRRLTISGAWPPFRTSVTTAHARRTAVGVDPSLRTTWATRHARPDSAASTNDEHPAFADGRPSGFSFGLPGFESSSRDVVAGAPTNQEPAWPGERRSGEMLTGLI